MTRGITLLAALALAACQAPAPQGDAVALARAAMVESARTAQGPLDAAAAADAVAGQRGTSEAPQGAGGGLTGLLGGG